MDRLEGQPTLLVFHRGEESSETRFALGLNTSSDFIINSSANTAPVAAEPDKTSRWAARRVFCVRTRTGKATKIEATHMPCSSKAKANIKNWAANRLSSGSGSTARNSHAREICNAWVAERTQEMT